jgi:hypothetical protein
MRVLADDGLGAGYPPARWPRAVGSGSSVLAFVEVIGRDWTACDSI